MDNERELVNVALAAEQCVRIVLLRVLFVAQLRKSEHFSQDTARGPNVDFASVVRVVVEEFGPAIVPRRDVGD